MVSNYVHYEEKIYREETAANCPKEVFCLYEINVAEHISHVAMPTVHYFGSGISATTPTFTIYKSVRLSMTYFFEKKKQKEQLFSFNEEGVEKVVNCRFFINCRLVVINLDHCLPVEKGKPNVYCEVKSVLRSNFSSDRNLNA